MHMFTIQKILHLFILFDGHAYSNGRAVLQNRTH